MRSNVTASLNKKMYNTYKKCNKLGIIPYIFGVPFSIGSIGFLIGSLDFLCNGEIFSGLMVLLGTLVFLIIAYVFGFAMIVDYIICIKNIKKQNYKLEKAVCISNIVSEEERYHDSTITEFYSKLCFKNEIEVFSAEEWGRFDVVPGNTYLLVFLRNKRIVTFMCNEENETVIFINTYISRQNNTL